MTRRDDPRCWADFGRWLVACRLEQGYTQTTVAGKAEISTQNLVSLEHGGFRRIADGPWILPNPRDETLVRLARVLGVASREMFQRVGRYSERPRTRESLRRSSGARALRERVEELERRIAALEAR